METFMLIVLTIISITHLFIGLVFAYLAYKIVKPEIKEEVQERSTGDTITKEDRIPIDQFIPRTDMPIKINQDKDNISK